MSALSDRLTQAAGQMKALLDTLAADCAQIESDINSQADARAQQAIATYAANAQSLINSTKQQADAQVALAKQDFDGKLAAAQADFKAQLAAAKAKK